MACAWLVSGGENVTKVGWLDSSARMTGFKRGISGIVSGTYFLGDPRREGGHHVAGEHAELGDPLVGWHAFRPVEDDVLESWILGLQLAQSFELLVTPYRPARPSGARLPRSSARRWARPAYPTVAPARRRSARNRTGRTTCSARRDRVGLQQCPLQASRQGTVRRPRPGPRPGRRWRPTRAASSRN